MNLEDCHKKTLSALTGISREFAFLGELLFLIRDPVQDSWVCSLGTFLDETRRKSICLPESLFSRLDQTKELWAPDSFQTEVNLLRQRGAFVPIRFVGDSIGLVFFEIRLDASKKDILSFVHKLRTSLDYLAQERSEDWLDFWRVDQDFADLLLGMHPEVAFLKNRIRTVAPSDASVVIIGESGTGKELVAKSLHYLSPRKNENFISLNCGVLNENLLESELFGHVRGAFTGADREAIGRFEAANRGTLFLDELGEMPPSLQVKLLRVLQEGEIERVGDHKKIPVDVRILSATHRDLIHQIEIEKFRLDLYYRIGVIPLKIPPLRERKSDLPLLSHHFLLECFSRYARKKYLSSEVETIFQDYDWPGNVRELENVIHHAVVLSEGDRIEPRHLPERLLEDTGWKKIADASKSRTGRFPNSMTLNEAVARFEADWIAEAVRSAGSQEEAAAKLGIGRGALQYKLKSNPYLQEILQISGKD